MQHYYTVQQCAHIYGVTENTVRNWIKRGLLDICRPGGRIIRIDIRSCDNLSATISYKHRR
jgi:excisionase family DNA binding protein